MTEAVEYDVLIVGSGPAGSTYARTIGDAVPTARILMVEVGPEVPGARGVHTLNLSPVDRALAQRLSGGSEGPEQSSAGPGGAALPGLFLLDPEPDLREGEVGLPAASMASVVGGMGIHWAASCPRPRESERVPFIPAAELDEALDQAERLLQVSTPSEVGGLTAAIRSALGAELDGPGLAPVTDMPSAFRRDGDDLLYAGVDVILGDLEQTSRGFELRSDTLARRVLVEDGVAVGAELEDRRTGERTQVRARYVVVCADTFRTPQLLFASSVRSPALGRYLNEHLQMMTFVVLDEAFTPQAHPDDRFFGYVSVPYSDARPIQGGYVALAGSPFAEAFAELPGLDRLGMLLWYGVKDLQSADAVELSDTETDGYGMPRMSIRYRHTERDLATIEQMRELSLRSAAALGTVAAEPALATGGASFHYHGSVRMGAVDDGTSVCDEHLRVWGVDHLYVGGNGVIPTATACNPTLTSVALAWRAATRLAQALGDVRA